MVWSEADQLQIDRMAKEHSITREQSAQALAVVIEYSKRLEAQIRKAPEDWLWSHRRWKSR
jgi:lauroyl/myristoyl acyltransferase